MRLAPATDDFYAMPWPHTSRLTDDGTLDLTGFPFPTSSLYLRDNLPILADGARGFGTTAAILMSFDAPLDPDSVERDAAESVGDDAHLALANIDPASPGFGERIPVTCSYRDAASDFNPPHFLSCLPLPGFPLRPNTLHGLFLTEAILAADGEPLQIATLLAADARPGASSPQEALLESYDPFVDFADSELDDLERVVGGTVFRTQDPVAPMRAIAALLEERAAPALDGNLMESQETAGDPDEQSGFTALEGVYEAPIFQAGQTPYNAGDGDIRFDRDGVPIIASFMKLRVVISIPDGEMPAEGWPLALYHHGTGGDAGSFVRAGHAHHLAAAGVAMAGIDAPVHGRRKPADADPTFLFFNIQNLLALRDNVRQGAADLIVLKRFALSLDVPADESPTGSPLMFDQDKLFYMGHSQGGLTGPLMLAVTDGFKGAMLSGAGGSIVTSIVHKKQPVDLLAAARVLINIPAAEPLDAFHPVLAVVQAFTEPADTSNFAPYFFRWDGGHALDVWATQGMRDAEVPPPIADAFMTAAGLEPLDPVAALAEGLALRGVSGVEGPVSENLTGADGQPYTGVFSQYPDGDHFIVSRDPAVETQLTAWFSSLVAGRGALPP